MTAKKKSTAGKKAEEKQIRKTIESFLKVLQIEGDFSVALSEEGIDVVLGTSDSGIVIGYHGEALDALQTILSLALSKKLNRFIRVFLEVGDYKKNRTSWLENLALSAKERALAERQEVALSSLKPWERRIVHLFLQDDESVVSESVGEGRERTLIVKPRA